MKWFGKSPADMLVLVYRGEPIGVFTDDTQVRKLIAVRHLSRRDTRVFAVPVNAIDDLRLDAHVPVSR